MTRTYCVGEPPEELVEYHRLVKRALDEAIAGVRGGASGHELFRGRASSSPSTATRRC